MYALMAPALIFVGGFAIDYTHAMQVQTKLDAAADAAVVAALTPAMMQQSNAATQTAATRECSTRRISRPVKFCGAAAFQWDPGSAHIYTDGPMRGHRSTTRQRL